VAAHHTDCNARTRGRSTRARTAYTRERRALKTAACAECRVYRRRVVLYTRAHATRNGAVGSAAAAVVVAAGERNATKRDEQSYGVARDAPWTRAMRKRMRTLCLLFVCAVTTRGTGNICYTPPIVLNHFTDVSLQSITHVAESA